MSIQHDTASTPFALNHDGAMAAVNRAAQFIIGAAIGAFRSIRAERRRRQTERQLNALSDALLKDIGLNRGEVTYVARSLAGRHPARNAPGR